MNDIVFLVGHENFGKSKTLKALTSGVVQYRYWKLGDIQYQIRRMSNDDLTDQWKEYIDSFIASKGSDLIIAMCPDFRTREKATKSYLTKLSKNYRLRFFVLKYAYGRSEMVKDEEIEQLREFGEVKLYEKKNTEASTRAKEFKAFVLENAKPNI